MIVLRHWSSGVGWATCLAGWWLLPGYAAGVCGWITLQVVLRKLTDLVILHKIVRRVNDDQRMMGWPDPICDNMMIALKADPTANFLTPSFPSDTLSCNNRMTG